jgi:hypothetical protein
VTDWLSPKILAPEVHLSLGFLVPLALWVKFHFGPGFGILALFVATVILKETLWDPKYEMNQPFLWEGAKDLLGYAVGIALFALFVLL